MAGPGFGVFGPLFGLLFTVAVVVLIVLAIRALRHGGMGHSHLSTATPTQTMAGHDEAIAIAKRRFANGEITSEQYEEIMNKLRL